MSILAGYRKVFALLAFSTCASVGSVVVATPASAAKLPVINVVCGQEIEQSLRLGNSLSCTGTDGLIIDGPGITLDMNGFGIFSIGTTHAGIRNSGHDDVTVRNGDIYGFETGVLFENVAHGVVRDLWVHSKGGISMSFASDRSLIRNNRVFGEDGGIIVNGADHTSIIGNTVTSMGAVLIAAQDSVNIAIKKNVTTTQKIGLPGVWLAGTDQSLVSGNRTEGTVQGVLLADSHDNKIVSNASNHDYNAIVALDSDRNVLTRNRASRTALVAIYLDPMSSDNIVTKNVSRRSGSMAYFDTGTNNELKKNLAIRECQVPAAC